MGLKTYSPRRQGSSSIRSAPLAGLAGLFFFPEMAIVVECGDAHAGAAGSPGGCYVADCRLAGQDVYAYVQRVSVLRPATNSAPWKRLELEASLARALACFVRCASGRNTSCFRSIEGDDSCNCLAGKNQSFGWYRLSTPDSCVLTVDFPLVISLRALLDQARNRRPTLSEERTSDRS